MYARFPGIHVERAGGAGRGEDDITKNFSSTNLPLYLNKDHLSSLWNLFRSDNDEITWRNGMVKIKHDDMSVLNKKHVEIDKIMMKLIINMVK